jgi:RNA polymerase sigma factor (sigma-70 family)
MTKEEIDIINSMRLVILRSIRLQRAIELKDVMQNLFVKVLSNYEKFGSLPNENEKRRYAFTACKNLLIDMHRRREVLYSKARMTTILMQSGDEKNYCAALQTNDLVEQVEIKEKLRKVLKTLQGYPLGKEVLWYSDGFKVREIADFTGQDINTVLGRIRYARNFLNKQVLWPGKLKKQRSRFKL